MRRSRAKPKAELRYNIQKQNVLKSIIASLAKKPHLDTRTESLQGDRKSAGVHLAVLQKLGRSGAMGDGGPDV